MMLIIVFIIGFIVGVFSPVLPLIADTVVDRLGGSPPGGRSPTKRGHK